jgi:hypothetical protein
MDSRLRGKDGGAMKVSSQLGISAANPHESYLSHFIRRVMGAKMDARNSPAPVSILPGFRCHALPMT